MWNNNSNNKIAIILTLFNEMQLRKKVLYVFATVIMGGFLENILIFYYEKITTYGIENQK